MSFKLSSDVYFCISDSRTALLDAKRNRYFCLSGDCDDAFQNLVKGGDCDAAQIELLGTLRDSGILADSLDPAFNSCPVRVIAPTHSLLDGPSPGVKSQDIIEALWLRWEAQTFTKLDFVGTLKRLRRRKGYAEGARQTAGQDTLLKAAFTFRSAAKFLGSNDQCLPRSVAMIDYLARRHCFPRLIIGVKMMPFSAHAWVQWEDLVVNDTLDKVLPYTPIVVI